MHGTGVAECVWVGPVWLRARTSALMLANSSSHHARCCEVKRAFSSCRRAQRRSRSVFSASALRSMSSASLRWRTASRRRVSSDIILLNSCSSAASVLERISRPRPNLSSAMWADGIVKPRWRLKRSAE